MGRLSSGSSIGMNSSTTQSPADLPTVSMVFSLGPGEGVGRWGVVLDLLFVSWGLVGSLLSSVLDDSSSMLSTQLSHLTMPR